MLVRWVFLAAILLAVPARADDAQARKLFNEGVAAANAQRLVDAVHLFEASLLELDRPGTRFNLVLANAALQRHDEVLRHGTAFLALPQHPARAEARARVEELVAKAQALLAVPLANREPASPPLPTPAPPASEAGATLPASTATPPTPPPAQAPRTRAPPRRQRRGRTPVVLVAASVGIALEVAALSVYAQAQRHANQLEHRDPSSSGFVPATERYWRLQKAVCPLTLAGGLLMSTAIAMHEGESGNDVGWAVTALTLGSVALGAGATLALRRPESIVAGTDLSHPRRQAGALLVSAALPLLTYGLHALWRKGHSHPRSTALAVVTRGLQW